MWSINLFKASLVAGATLLSAVAAAAQVVPDDILRAELREGWRLPGGTQMAALHLTLAPGWKTYWRSPGEAGLPVQISQNGEALDILFPIPERFELFGLETYGYSHAVMIPFHIKPTEAETLTIQASFMVCKDICVPFDASYEVPKSALGADYSSHDVRVAAWLKKSPDRTADGGGGLEILKVKLTGVAGRQRLVVDAKADAMLGDADMFAEVNEMVHFGAPKMKLLEDGRTARFVLAAMTGKKPMDLLNHTARLTFTDGLGHAIERNMKILRD